MRGTRSTSHRPTDGFRVGKKPLLRSPSSSISKNDESLPVGIVFDEQGQLQDPAVRAQLEKYIADFARVVVRVNLVL